MSIPRFPWPGKYGATDADTMVTTYTTTVGDIAQRVSGEIVGPRDLRVTGLNTLEEAGPGDLSFIGSPKHAALWPGSRAVAALVTRGIETPGHDAGQRALIVVKNADIAMAQALEMFLPPAEPPLPGVSSTAFVHPTAQVDSTATVMDRAWIGPGVIVGPRCVLEQNVWIGAQTTLGADCVLRAGVVVRERCVIGNRVSIHPNAVIGADGFGYRPDGKGGLVKVPHIGTVEIQDDVEIGACATVDRGKFGATVVGAHTKLDNLTHVAHNVRVGRGVVMAALSGIAGSAVVGDWVQIAGHSGVADHVTVASGVKLAAHSGIMSKTEPGDVVGGTPAVNLRDFWRMYSAWIKLPESLRILDRLQRRVDEISAPETVSAKEQAS